MTTNFSHLTKVIGTFCLFLILVGCGGTSTRGPLSESEVVKATVASLSDAAGDESSFQASFVSGQAPEQGEDYSSCLFTVIGEPTLSGDEATVEVEVKTGFADSSQGDSRKKTEQTKETRNVTWTLSKSDGSWKLQSAPLK